MLVSSKYWTLFLVNFIILMDKGHLHNIDFQKTLIIILSVDGWVLIFFLRGEIGYFHSTSGRPVIENRL